MAEYNSRNARTWSMLGACGTFGMAAAELAENDEDFAVVTADLCFFSGLDRMKEKHPDKLYNVGIAEQNMIGVAAGMVKEGMNVFTTTYASFASTRVLDQVKVNMGYMKLPIKLVGLTSGYSVGILGATHMSVEDIAIMRTIPDMVVLSPADCTETMKCIHAAYHSKSPVYIRLTGTQRTPIVYSEDYEFTIGKPVVLKEGTDVTFFATGTMVAETLKAVKALEAEGISCSVLDIHTIKPLDAETIKKYANSKLIVTVEEHNVIGGLGSAVAEVLCKEKEKAPQLMIGIEDFYPHAANYEHLMELSGLTADSIVKRTKEAL